MPWFDSSRQAIFVKLRKKWLLRNLLQKVSILEKPIAKHVKKYLIYVLFWPINKFSSSFKKSANHASLISNEHSNYVYILRNEKVDLNIFPLNLARLDSLLSASLNDILVIHYLRDRKKTNITFKQCSSPAQTEPMAECHLLIPPCLQVSRPRLSEAHDVATLQWSRHYIGLTVHDMARAMHRRVGKPHHAVVFDDMMPQTLAGVSKRYLATTMPIGGIMVVTRDCMMLTYLPSAIFLRCSIFTLSLSLVLLHPAPRLTRLYDIHSLQLIIVSLR